jgi:guanylate kinase
MNQLNRIDDFRKVLGSYQLSDAAKATLSATKLALMVGPSSSGRNTIINELVKSGGFHYIVSDTTREMRTKDGVLIEQNGREYWFRQEDEVLADLQKGDFLEAAIIHEQQVSGISIREIEAAHAANQVAITDIEFVGATTIHGLKPDTLFFFVLPPSFDEWMVRMSGRGKLPDDEVRRRMQSAVKEITTALENDYYWFVVNDTFVQTAQKVDEAIKAGANDDEEQTRGRQVAKELLVATQAHLAL